MRIVRLELTNFRTFGHAVFEDIAQTVVLVSPNGRGKSSVLEAIAGVKDLVAPYHRENYEFREQWQQRSVPIWPQHLPVPVKIGARQAKIKIEVQPSDDEKKYLESVQIRGQSGAAEVVIEDGRHIVSQSSNDVINRLFQYHNPSEGLGFIDYIRPIRFYQASVVGNFADDLTDNRIRHTLSEFHRPPEQHTKFSGFKSFAIGTQLNDLSHWQATEQQRDSLALFREVFNRFFAPKTFVGYEQGASGIPRIVVGSPFGNHDTDALSDGEKEILHILSHLYRFRQLPNVVLWDTPELHLNASLESRLYSAIREISPNNQGYESQSSIELINSVPLEDIVAIRQVGDCATIERVNGENRKARVAIYREMGAEIGLQLVSTVVAFLEGKDASLDKVVMDRLVAPQMPGVNFIAAGSCQNVLAAGSRANQLIASGCTNGDFFAIVDRDYREDSELSSTTDQYKGRVFLWNVHEVENLFLAPGIVLHTLSFLSLTNANDTEETLYERLKSAARSVRE